MKNTQAKDLAFALIEAAMSPEVQAKLMESPYLIVPTNTKVKIAGEVAKALAKDHADMKKKFVFQDWKKINEQRSRLDRAVQPRDQGVGSNGLLIPVLRGLDRHPRRWVSGVTNDPAVGKAPSPDPSSEVGCFRH